MASSTSAARATSPRTLRRSAPSRPLGPPAGRSRQRFSAAEADQAYDQRQLDGQGAAVGGGDQAAPQPPTSSRARASRWRPAPRPSRSRPGGRSAPPDGLTHGRHARLLGCGPLAGAHQQPHQPADPGADRDHVGALPAGRASAATTARRRARRRRGPPGPRPQSARPRPASARPTYQPPGTVGPPDGQQRDRHGGDGQAGALAQQLPAGAGGEQFGQRHPHVGPLGHRHGRQPERGQDAAARQQRPGPAGQAPAEHGQPGRGRADDQRQAPVEATTRRLGGGVGAARAPGLAAACGVTAPGCTPTPNANAPAVTCPSAFDNVRQLTV